jgi:hypothetical protein
VGEAQAQEAHDDATEVEAEPEAEAEKEAEEEAEAGAEKERTRRRQQWDTFGQGSNDRGNRGRDGKGRQLREA